MASLPNILLVLAAISMGATVIAALVALRSQKEASSAIFPIVREEEANRARRARLSIFVWIAITALFVGGWLATLRLNPATTGTVASSTEPPVAPPATQAIAQQNPPTEPTLVEPAQIEPTPTTAVESQPTETSVPGPEPLATDTPIPPATDTPQPAPSETPLPATATPQPTPTETPLSLTVTPTDSPTTTPTAAVGAIEAATVSPRTPAPENVRVGPIQFATEITNDLEAIDPGKVFPNGIETVYAVFPYRGMTKDLDFKVIWYHNGVEISREDGKWQWGKQANLFVFIGPRGDGLYKLELYINDSVVATNLFEIIPYPDP